MLEMVHRFTKSSILRFSLWVTIGDWNAKKRETLNFKETVAAGALSSEKRHFVTSMESTVITMDSIRYQSAQ